MVHVSCHVSLTGSKLNSCPVLPAGGQTAMIPGDFGRVRSGDYSHAIRGGVVNVLRVAPPTICRRSVNGGDVLRQRARPATQKRCRT
jgi:hypothetical protein